MELQCTGKVWEQQAFKMQLYLFIKLLPCLKMDLISEHRYFLTLEIPSD